MIGRVVLCGFVGGILSLLWSFFSWTVLPWHAKTIHQFSNEEFVSWVIQEHAPQEGVYVIPHWRGQEGDFLLQEKEKAKRPFLYVQVKKEGESPGSFHLFLRSFLIQFVGAILVSVLLLQGNVRPYAQRLLFFTLFGLTVGVLGLLPNWNSMGAPLSYTLVMIADLLMQWFIVGVCVAPLAKPQSCYERMM